MSNSIGFREHKATYISWQAMRRRCTQKAEYASRGIKVCGRWASFDNFLSDMGERPEGKTIDRIDNNSGYEPSNCRWATPQAQARNRRDNRLVRLGNGFVCLSEYCERTGISRDKVKYRLKTGAAV